MPKDTYFITTAIDYTNGAPHIGHAYEKILADVMARYQRLAGRQVFFLTGVDQHGQKVQQSAQKAGISPAEFAEANTEKFLAVWKLLDISYDGWAATTADLHKQAVRQVLQRLHDEGQLYKAAHSGFYSVRQEQFLTDKERNDAGEFGPDWGEVVELQEENYYFPLAKEAEWLTQLLQQHPELVFPDYRRAELLNAIGRISGDLCISRPSERLSWGIPFPFDPEFVTYVWFDALLNYLTFAGYLKDKDNTNLPDLDRLWPCDAHVIGKDILVPSHGIYWPIMLKGLGFDDTQIPKIVVHGWWNIAGEKQSKSLGNVVDPVELAGKYGPDTVRYYLMRDIRTGQDADFYEQRLHERYNADLANDLGNLLNRSLNMTQRYRDGKLTRPDQPMILGNECPEVVASYHTAMENWRFDEALEAIWRWISAANAFVESEAPWKLAKQENEAEHLDQVLYELCEMLRIVALLVQPVMPATAKRIWAQLGLEAEGLPAIGKENPWGGLPSGHVVAKPEPLFPRLEME